MVREQSAKWAWWRRLLTVTLLILALLFMTLIILFFHFLVTSTSKLRSRVDPSENQVRSSDQFVDFVENGTTTKVNLDTWEAPLEIQQKFIYSLAGYDYKNNPVWIVPFGTYNIREFLDAEDGENNEKLLELYTDQFYHRVQQSRLNGPGHKVNSSYVIISDMEEYTYSQFASYTTIQFLTRMAQKFAGPVSEMQYGFVLNLDWVSQMLVTMARPILGAALDKMEMFRAESDEVISKILDKIPANQLPIQYGGSSDYKPVAVYGQIEINE